MHSALAADVSIELQSDGTSKVDGTASTDYSSNNWVCMDGSGDLTGKIFTITSVDTLSCGSNATYGIDIKGDTAFSASVSEIDVKCNYGINLDSSGTNNITGVKSITVEPSSSFASGIYIDKGINSITFNGTGSFIKATSTNKYVQGVSLTNVGKTKVSNLENITVETMGTDPSESSARGINLGNMNTAGASDPEFSVSFVTTGGSISAYSAQGENCGIRFGNGSTIAKSEVLNVKTITAGVKSGADSAGTAYGIYAKASINKVTFTGADSSITAKSSGSDAYGIYVLGGTNTISGLGSITVETAGSGNFAYGIYSNGTADTSANNVSFKGNGGQAITVTNTTSAANAYSIYAEGKGATTISFENGILSGKIHQQDTATVTLNFNNGGMWMPVTGDVTGTVNVNVNNGGSIVFDLPAATVAGDTMLKMSGTVNIADGSKIQVINGKATKLQEDDVICLIENNADITLGSNVTKQHSSDGIVWSDAEIYLNKDDAKKLMYKRTKMGLEPDGSKAPVEGMAAAAGVVNTTADIVTGAGMANMITSTATTSGTEPFAAASFGKGRLETGSHVDTKGYGIVVGVGKKVFDKIGNKTTGGLFFEYGNSDFDTYNNAVTGSGKGINKGVGYMMRWDNKKSGNYYEGMLHGGKINTSWSNSMGGYNISPTYFGGALTYGHKFMVGEDKQLSVYGSYIYNRTGGGDAKIAGYEYSFNATNSHRTKVGVRYAMSDLMDTKKFRPYVGLAWEHEYKGDTVATVRGFGEAPSPSMKGNSGILEIGCKQDVGKWTLGIGAELYTGKRRGWNGTLQATYNF